MIVKASLVNEYFGANEGRRAKVLRAYWRNGEDHYSLRDTVTGESFDSPAIFWAEVVSSLDMTR